MTLDAYKEDMMTCCRCSACKFVPLETLKGYDHVTVCPSIARFDYRAYSGGGRLGLGVALLENKIDYSSEKLRDVVYNCQMCGACDVSCKYAMDMEVLEPLSEIRAEMVKHENVPASLTKLAAALKQNGTMVLDAAAGRGEWAKDLAVKDYTREQTDIVFHAGCRTSSDPSLWNVARSSIKLMQKAGVDVGISFGEMCCGGRAYQMGFQSESAEQAKRYMAVLKKAGVKTLVTGCADCYYSFKVLYEKFGLKNDIEVLHTSEYFNNLIKEKKLLPTKPVDMTVTYHDPCHLGRQGEDYIHWKGSRVPGQVIIFDPPKEFRRGDKGIYNAPREVLLSIPGLKLREMDRHKEFAWCCGAGGGVRESNPEYARWTATERINEAACTEAEAIVSGCPGCESLFTDTIKQGSRNLKVYDIVELLAESVL
ncbi:MAG: (Fe-S)-binding protein [Actinobacteria bacterium]|nr:(Fe-S)-binding protein [Actinomycetota bacterium]